MLGYECYITLEDVDTAQRGKNLAPSLSAMTVLREGLVGRWYAGVW